MRHAFATLLLATTLVACDDPAAPLDEGPAMLTVNAVEGWAFVELGDPSAEVSVGDPTTSTAWDVAFFATSVMLNGGDAGPGGLQGYCVCQNASATDSEVLAMTAESELAAFEGVSAADIPTSEEAWLGEALHPAIEGWWSYDAATHVVSAEPGAVWLVRLSDGTAFAKVHVVALENATQAHAGEVTIEFAVQPAAGEPMGDVQQLTVDLAATSPARVDLQTASLTDGDAWDIAFEAYTLRVNGGVSGVGQAGAVATQEEFGAVEDASGAPSSVYAADGYGGVFASNEPGTRWYRYNLQGNHQIWPTYNVYLVRRGTELFKLQLVGYYSDTGESRHITFRYARVAE